ncbi:hypothetical protein BGZ83_002607 [Gryganskiella cystojenkinii]|nr:hypothetical protein BGZ83_002607 [Gryganskiella cystojenkinii]
MNYSSDIPEANVEDMSNAELFQYLFRAELDHDLPLPDIVIDSTSPAFFTPSTTTSPASSGSSPVTTASIISSSPRSLGSPYPLFDNNNSSSPTSSSMNFNSPPPYQQYNFSQQQEQQQIQQMPLFQQTQQSTLLPSTSFSYRQISPDMPPRMPEPSTSLVVNMPQQPSTSEYSQQFIDLALTATANAASSTDNSAFWMQRFQQLQQLQQVHHFQQKQLLSTTLMNNDSNIIENKSKSGNQSDSSSPGRFSNNGSDRSVSPSSPSSFSSSSSFKKSPSVKAEKDVIYPSPPMNDEDMNMDSDEDDDGPSSNNNSNGSTSDPLKPSPSELKKMTSKERRQLRNKLSARNFRVRRKEYIGALEADLREARREAAELQRKLAQSELNCQFLRQELETSRVSQTLFNDGRGMSKEHANLLASLLNPNTESFPTSTSASTITSTNNAIINNDQQQQKALMDSIHHNNMTILNNSLTVAGAAAASTSNTATATNDLTTQGSMQPYMPYDGDWELIVNRLEMDENPAPLDPKDIETSKSATAYAYHDLLTKYENARLEAERDEQMRLELKAYNEQKLAQTYVVVPNSGDSSTVTSVQHNTMFLQTIVYMMMIHLTKSMFEAATLSKTELVNMYQTMDGPLRSKMGQVLQERELQQQQGVKPCKFLEWREAWIKKWWPSFYNNRLRVCELLKFCKDSSYSTESAAKVEEIEEADVTTTVRKMEEGVRGKTVQPSLCLRVMSMMPDWLKCPQMLACEKQQREMLSQQAVEEISSTA